MRFGAQRHAAEGRRCTPKPVYGMSPRVETAAPQEVEPHTTTQQGLASQTISLEVENTLLKPRLFAPASGRTRFHQVCRRTENHVWRTHYESTSAQPGAHDACPRQPIRPPPLCGATRSNDALGLKSPSYWFSPPPVVPIDIFDTNIYGLECFRSILTSCTPPRVFSPSLPLALETRARQAHLKGPDVHEEERAQESSGHLPQCLGRLLHVLGNIRSFISWECAKCICSCRLVVSKFSRGFGDGRISRRYTDLRTATPGGC